MAPPAKKSNRGGWREGAGRKPFLKGAERLSVSLEEPEYKAVEKLAEKRGVSIASVIREAVKAYVAKRRS